MIDLPDYGYTSYSLNPVDPAGVTEGSLGGPSDIIDRPGYRYAVAFTLPSLATDKDARIFQALLEQGSRDDVSYPWPLDVRAVPAGTPVVDGASAAGAVIPIRGLAPNYQFKLGQPLAVISNSTGFIHRASAVTTADATGSIILPVYPMTRMAFSDGDTIEVERPRIRGVLSWSGAQQQAFGSRPFTFTITERR